MSKLLDTTLKLLAETNKTYKEIAADTGLTYHMVSKILNKGASTPGVEACEKLYVYLSGKELEL